MSLNERDYIRAKPLDFSEWKPARKPYKTPLIVRILRRWFK